MTTWPASMQLATLTADFRGWNTGGGLAASVNISTSHALVSQTDSVIVPRIDERFRVANGIMSIQLPVNNDADWTPHDWPYLVRVIFYNGHRMAWLVYLVGNDTLGQTYDLANVGHEVDYPDNAGPFNVLFPIVVESVFGRIGHVVGQAGDYTLDQVTGLPAALAGKAPIESPVFTGAVTLPGAPTSPLHAATKAYVDTNGGGGGGGVPTSRLITSGTGLTGGGDLTADRTLNVIYGTTAGTAAAGNDTRLTGLSAALAGLAADIAARQPLDTDLSTIAALTATTDNMIQSVGSAWASRTPAQVKVALAIAQADVAGLSTALNLLAPLTNPTFTGAVTLAADPTSGLQAATKSYVDGIAANVGKRTSARAATTANVTISTGLNNGDVVDGVTLSTGDQVLVKNQTAQSENGIYIVGVTPVRASEFDTYNEHAGSLVVVVEGTTQAGSIWLCTSNVGGILGTTALVYSQTTATGALMASNNLSDLTNTATARANLGVQPLDADLTTIAGLIATTDNFLQSKGSAWASRTPAQVVADLQGLLTIAEAQVTGLTAALAAKQPLDADLTTIAALTATTDNFMQSKGSAWASRTPAQVAADLQTLLTIAEAQVTGLTAALAGKQPLDPDLTAIAGLTATTDNVIQAKAGVWTSRTIAQLAADIGAAGGTFQPLDADLTTIASLTAATDNMIQSVGNAWASRTPAQVKAALAIAQADVTGLVAALAALTASDAGKQPLDADLTTIASLTPTTDVFLQSKASAWTTRTPAQVAADIQGSVALDGAQITTGTVNLARIPTVTLPKIADIGAGTVLGNNTASAAAPAALTTSQTKALLNIGIADVSGLQNLLDSMGLSNPQISYWDGAAYSPAISQGIYVGPSDPGAKANGSVWIINTPLGGDSTPPTTPTGLGATVIGGTQINLSWTASTDAVGVTGYEILRAPGASGGSFAPVGTTASTTFSHTGLAFSSTNRYQVRAYDAAGNVSGVSATVSATTTDGTPIGQLGAGVRATPGSVGYLGTPGSLITLNPGDSFVGTPLQGTASDWSGGALLVRGSNITIDGYRINAPVYFESGTNHILRNSVVTAPDGAIYGVGGNDTGSTLTVEDCTIITHLAYGALHSAGRLVARRCDISGAENAIVAYGKGTNFATGTIITQCYMHDLGFTDLSQHADTIQVSQHPTIPTFITIEHSLLARSTGPGGVAISSSITVGNNGGTDAVIAAQIDNNAILAGGFHLRVEERTANCVITNNNLGLVDAPSGEFGLAVITPGSYVTFSGNVDGSGNPVSP